jgi:predicted secreted protein
MSLSFGIAIYFVIWWVLLFAILPFGVRTSEEAGESSNPGFAESAPHRPRLLPKIVATTIISGIVFAFIYAILEHKIFGLDDIPFFPRYEKVRQTP